MQISYFFLAETVAQDAGGVFSAIRIGQNIELASSLPIQTKRAVVLGLEDKAQVLSTGDVIQIEIRIDAPSRSTLAGTSTQVPLGEKRYSDLPGALLLPTELQLQLPEFGEYTIAARVTDPAGEVAEARLSLYALRRDERLPEASD